MAGVVTRNFDTPDTTRTPDKAIVHSVDLGGTTVGRATFQPGWRWSESIKPIVGGDQCQVHHLGILLSGKMHVAHGDGTEADLLVGEVYNIQPGHDAWVVGDEPAVAVEFDPTTAAIFAKD
ncbi:MAG: cupin domain-containing protein [Acidimicrobiales bacterium]